MIKMHYPFTHAFAVLVTSVIAEYGLKNDFKIKLQETLAER
jgi:hypothetical protein